MKHKVTEPAAMVFPFGLWCPECRIVVSKKHDCATTISQRAQDERRRRAMAALEYFQELERQKDDQNGND